MRLFVCDGVVPQLTLVGIPDRLFPSSVFHTPIAVRSQSCACDVYTYHFGLGPFRAWNVLCAVCVVVKRFCDLVLEYTHKLVGTHTVCLGTD